MVSTLEARPRLSSQPRPNLLPAQVGLLASKPPAVHPRLPEVRTSPYSTQSCLVKLFQVFGRFNRLGSLCFPCAVCTSILPSPTQYWWQLSEVSWYYVTFLCLKIGSLQIGRHLEAGGRSLWKFQLVILAISRQCWAYFGLFLTVYDCLWLFTTESWLSPDDASSHCDGFWDSGGRVAVF